MEIFAPPRGVSSLNSNASEFCFTREIVSTNPNESEFSFADSPLLSLPPPLPPLTLYFLFALPLDFVSLHPFFLPSFTLGLNPLNFFSLSLQ